MTQVPTPDSAVEILSAIQAVAVVQCPDEASAIIREGAILLAVTPSTQEDQNEFPFKYCLGLPREVHKSPYLTNLFR